MPWSMRREKSSGSVVSISSKVSWRVAIHSKIRTKKIRRFHQKQRRRAHHSIISVLGASRKRSRNVPGLIWQWISISLIHRGLRVQGQSVEELGRSDPLAAIAALNSLANPESAAILVLENFHRFLQSAEIVQALIEQITVGKQNRTFVVVLSPVVNLPVELEKLFVVLEHPLPDRTQLAEIAQGIATEAGELPEGAELECVLDAASGLTRHEAENALSLSLVRHGEVH
jgi:hypothetical protein